MLCRHETCMFPLMCSKCLQIHEAEYQAGEHKMVEVYDTFDSEEKRIQFSQDLAKEMEIIDSEIDNKQDMLKSAYSEFTMKVMQVCHRYYVNNNIDTVRENLRNEFEISKAEYQVQMNPDTLRKMAEDFLRLRKVDEAIKENSHHIMSKEQIFQHIENELENLNQHVTNQLLRLETKYKEDLLSIVDYDIEKHLSLLDGQGLKQAKALGSQGNSKVAISLENDEK